MAETSAAGEAQILYLEPDDEIPSVVRRVRESELPRVVLVAPGRSKATSSAIGLRLLARHATEVGRQLSLGPGLSRMEDTQAVPVAPPLRSSGAAGAAAAAPAIGRVRRRSAPLARTSRGVLIAILAAMLVVAALIAAVLPAATVRITPSVA